MSTESLSGVLDALNEIASTSSRREKEALIVWHLRKTPWFGTVVLYAYDPDRVYGIRFIPPVNNAENPPSDARTRPVAGLSRLFDALDMLAGKTPHSGSQRAAATISDIISVDQPTAIVLNRILCKDLECGVGIRTWAKYVDGLREHQVMLAERDRTKFLRMYSGPFCWSTKMDGIRVWAIVEGDKVTYKTRNGKVVKNFHVFNETLLEASRKLGSPECVFDGEVVFNTGKFHHAAQLLHKEHPDPEDLARLIFYVFEIPSLASTKPLFRDRYEALKRCFETHGGVLNIYKPFHNVVLLTHFDINPEEFEPKAREIIDLGCEGIMIKPWDYRYECKRSRAWLKMKALYLKGARVEVDLRVLDATPHSKDPTKIGALVVDYNGHLVGVGTGLTDNHRALPREWWVGKVITIQADSVTNDGSLRFPVFVRIRDDLT